ncbi:type VI secretion system-associated protein TagF [uncultured Pseudacidovorax sp.]|uniref:type VI secretion system-associated protein TagF n=1 Tax=uncultured Pseudacidovorax sp. TaxID=679313 RepID=UPI0025CC4BC9|nr:type VI secretion system-associated protein TagF [uncultured Pseudacidovorax sp.]
MLRAWIEARQVTPPAIWGKLPGHADFVRSGVRHRESEGWAPWLAQVAEWEAGYGDASGAGQGATAVPVAFVLPPRTLAFAPRRFVVGVIAPSSDRVGRQHPLLVYQLARPGWVRRQFDLQAHTSRDWLFWLARAVARQLGQAEGADMQPLERLVDGLWAVHSGESRRRPRPVPSQRREPPKPQADAQAAAAQALLDELAGPAPAHDPAAQLHGVRHLPWADWPQRLLSARPGPVFWQQDADGGYVNAATSLAQLWSRLP